ncbi:MAG: hypothetical protein M5U34_07505 [Chloroflexi bacterium]|nr:hypothetical protein [Chloroflexota bacterium]
MLPLTETPPVPANASEEKTAVLPPAPSPFNANTILPIIFGLIGALAVGGAVLLFVNR